MDKSQNITGAGAPGPGSSGLGSAWPLLALLVVAGVFLYVIQGRRPSVDDAETGQPLPPVSEVAGWLNTGQPLTDADLRGQVVLVEYWFTSCGFCTQKRPGLIALNEQYGDHGLKVVGFTPEPFEARDAVKRYVEKVEGMDWPIAYGAAMAIEMMGVQGFPTYTLYDRSGKSVLSNHSLDGMEEAIAKALVVRR